MSGAIFEYESEPLFNTTEGRLSAQQLEEWLFVLSVENIANIKKVTAATKRKSTAATSAASNGRFKHGIPVSLIMRVCDRFKQKAEVRYQAIELYDHFMVCHIHQLRRHCEDNSSDGAKRRKQWSEIVERVEKQALLRVFTCIQLAGKLHAPKEGITVALIEKLLKKMGIHFGRPAIMKSELRVLETVAYNPAVPTPLVHLETLLEILGRNDASVNVKSLYHVCLKVLNLVYLRWTKVYSELFKRISHKSRFSVLQSEPTTPAATPKCSEKNKRAKRPSRKSRKIEQHYWASTDSPLQATPQENDDDQMRPGALDATTKYFPVTKDLLFLSTAVISCAAYHLDQAGYLRITEQIAQITHIAQNEIIEFTIVLVGLSLKDHSEGSAVAGNDHH